MSKKYLKHSVESIDFLMEKTVKFVFWSNVIYVIWQNVKVVKSLIKIIYVSDALKVSF